MLFAKRVWLYFLNNHFARCSYYSVPMLDTFHMLILGLCTCILKAKHKWVTWQMKSPPRNMRIASLISIRKCSLQQKMMRTLSATLFQISWCDSGAVYNKCVSLTTGVWLFKNLFCYILFVLSCYCMCSTVYWVSRAGMLRKFWYFLSYFFPFPPTCRFNGIKHLRVLKYQNMFGFNIMNCTYPTLIDLVLYYSRHSLDTHNPTLTTTLAYPLYA